MAAVHDGQSAIPLPRLARRRARAFASVSRVTVVLESMAHHSITAVSPLHPQWPTHLAVLRGAAPLVLFTRGDASALSLPAVALTGTAAPTGLGVHWSLELGTGLADREWVVAAGAGSGIDQWALKAARAMCGTTITVAATSLERIAARAIGPSCSGGVWVSELPPTALMTVRSERWARQLLAAISVKTLLLEASLASRAMRTAQAAHALSRPAGWCWAQREAQPAPAAGCSPPTIIWRLSGALPMLIGSGDRTTWLPQSFQRVGRGVSMMRTPAHTPGEPAGGFW